MLYQHTNEINSHFIDYTKADTGMPFYMVLQPNMGPWTMMVSSMLLFLKRYIPLMFKVKHFKQPRVLFFQKSSIQTKFLVRFSRGHKSQIFQQKSLTSNVKEIYAAWTRWKHFKALSQTEQITKSCQWGRKRGVNRKKKAHIIPRELSFQLLNGSMPCR